MAKVVEINAKSWGLEKDYRLIDTPQNVKQISKDVREMFKKISEMDNEANRRAKALEEGKDVSKLPVYFVTDYQLVVLDAVIKSLSALMHLTKEESKKLEDVSYSDMFNIYQELATKFIQMQIPDFAPNDDQESVDEDEQGPKNSDNQ